MRSVISVGVLDCNIDVKQLYSLVSNLTLSTKENPLPDCNSDEELAASFSEFFMTQIKKIRDSLESFPKYQPVYRNTMMLSSFNPYSEEKITKIIKNMASKHCKLDPVLTWLLKEILPFVISPITNIINMSLEQGIFTRQWKVSLIKPLIKKLWMDLVNSSYHPVSNLSFLSKALEKCALSRFTAHYDEEDLPLSYQSAYRRNLSCETALLKLVNDCLWNMENQNVTAIIAIDPSATLNTDDHSILLEVLNKRYGINGSALTWFDSYLRPHSCKVVIGEASAMEKDLANLVPQGSVAGPVLYNCYASTISEVVKPPLQLHGFADDHTVKDSFKPGTHEERLVISNLKNCTGKIKLWMDKNRLHMNSSKTKFLLVGSMQQLSKRSTCKCTTDSIQVNGEIVKHNKCIKYLGTLADDRLNFKDFINALWNLQKLKNMCFSDTRGIHCPSNGASDITY